MKKLSVVIITLNEEDRIAGCIDSVTNVADEVLIVDSFSTDRTQKISEEKGATFIQNKFLGHIQQKNFGIARASYDCVLSLDADEQLDEEAQTAIQLLKGSWTHDSYTLKRLTNYCGKWIKHCGWYPDKKVRIFDRSKAEWGGVNPHDKILLNEGATNKQIGGNILHYSYPTISSHAKTADSFSEIAANAAIANGKRINFVVHVLLNPPFTFIKKYFFQLGILDGFYGLVICVLSTYSSFLKYSKIWQLSRENSNIKNR